jgi:hypothetical protein
MSARIFLSCGQGSSKEMELAETIKERIEDELHFIVYVARMDHSLNSLTQNIFEKIDDSEYFLFIDFRREQITPNRTRVDGGDHPVYRGSLFTNQELSVAAFLRDIDILGFQEEGVKELDGMLRYLQINCDIFSVRDSLPDLIIRKIREASWNPNWRNELKMEYIAEGIPARVITNTNPAEYDTHTFYHFKVSNLNARKVALNCSAYIEKIETEGIPQYTPSLAELKWKNQVQDSLSIPPGESRLLDAYRIPSNREWIMLAINTHLIDYQGLPLEYILREGVHVITYVIYSENFSPTRIKIRITKNGRTIIPSVIRD